MEKLRYVKISALGKYKAETEVEIESKPTYKISEIRSAIKGLRVIDLYKGRQMRREFTDVESVRMNKDVVFYAYEGQGTFVEFYD
jgi:hypothetical protein